MIPEQQQDLRIDLSDACDEENNPVGLFTCNPEYLDAQRWHVVENADGSYCIQTAYDSHRALTVEGIGQEAVIRERSETLAESQEWIISH